MKSILFVLISLVFTFSCVKKTSYTNMNSNSKTSDKSSKIIGGRDVTTKDVFAKHIVGIYKKKETVCTGVIIAKDAILTAAHCVDEMKKGSISFGLNKKNLEFRQIRDYFQHPKYDGDVEGLIDTPVNDVMVVRFFGDLPSGYEPAEILDQGIVQSEMTVILAGYGRDEDDHYDYLKMTEVKVVEAKPYEFRTEEKKTGSCDGDSGGPVFFKNADEKYILVGSVSRGDTNCHQYGIYENISYYKNWITESIQNLESK
jgi:V8-like Glu-specific endopeptidase